MKNFCTSLLKEENILIPHYFFLPFYKFCLLLKCICDVCSETQSTEWLTY